jgi:hypothetical protein
MITAQELKKEIFGWATELQVNPKEVHIMEMKNKWASCSSKGRLSFSKALLEEPKEVRSKAIVHELLHLKYPNHGKMFKALLKSHLSKEGISCTINDLNIKT